MRWKVEQAQRIVELEMALKEVNSCFDAAECEGLTIALAETQDEHLKDLVERRLRFANTASSKTLKITI